MFDKIQSFITSRKSGQRLDYSTLSSSEQGQTDLVARATVELGLALFRALAAGSPRKNLLLSPLSINTALALAASAASGETRHEIARCLGLNGNADAALSDIDKLRDDLVRLSQSVSSLLGSRATDARDMVTDTASGLYETGLDYAQDAEAQVRGMAGDLTKQIERNPLAAIGIVFGVGYVIGMMRRR